LRAVPASASSAGSESDGECTGCEYAEITSVKRGVEHVDFLSVLSGGALYQKQGFLQSSLPPGLFLGTRIFFLSGNPTSLSNCIAGATMKKKAGTVAGQPQERRTSAPASSLREDYLNCHART
jgi:hypothetical protein